MKPKHKFYWQARKRQAKLRSRKSNPRPYFGINWHPYKVDMFNKASFYRASEGCQTVIGTFDNTYGINPFEQLCHEIAKRIAGEVAQIVDARKRNNGLVFPVWLWTDNDGKGWLRDAIQAKPTDNLKHYFLPRLKDIKLPPAHSEAHKDFIKALNLPKFLEYPQSDLHQSYLDSLLNAHKDEPDENK